MQIIFTVIFLILLIIVSKRLPSEIAWGLNIILLWVLPPIEKILIVVTWIL